LGPDWAWFSPETMPFFCVTQLPAPVKDFFPLKSGISLFIVHDEIPINIYRERVSLE
jgi:hypothetical protein